MDAPPVHEEKLDGDNTKILRAVLNKSWKQHPTKQHRYDHLPPISQTIQARHAWYCWGSKNELISDVLCWTPTQGHTKVDCPVKTYIHQFCLVWFVGFYGIAAFVGYLTPNPFFM